jgi:hypothetical protein
MLASATPASVVDAVPRAATLLTSSAADAHSVRDATPSQAAPLVMASVVTVPVTTGVSATSQSNELGRSAGVAAPERPIVRVHIGRLEIRATLPEPQPSRPAPIREAAPETLSLSKYLRGSR